MRRLAAVAAAVAVVVVAALLLTRPGSGSASGGSAGTGAAVGSGGGVGSGGAVGSGAGAAVTVSVSATPAGRAVPSGFLGFSFEFQAVRAYTGTDPAHINPVLVALMRNLTPGQAPVLRIGGDSTDVSYVPGRGIRPPVYVGYRLTPGWLATTSALARTLRARLIMGLNLAADSPALAAAEAGAYMRAFGPGAIEAFEIGNEPNVYGKITDYRTVFGIPLAARSYAYGYAQYAHEFAALAHAAPGPALAGPALAIGPVPNNLAWVDSVPGFLGGNPRVSIMTIHRYPLRNCYVPPRSAQYPSIAHLLSPYATVTLASSLRRWIDIAHAQHRVLRVDELNSVACRGKAGVSDTFASALWATDALFSLVHAGVDGIDMHTLPDTAYELFQFSQHGGRWEATVRPVYYGLQLFAQAAPAGSRLLSVSDPLAGSGLSAWATRDAGGTVRVVLINKSTRSDRLVRLSVPGGSSATVERMLAPSVSAKSGVTLGGRTYGASTSTGALGSPVVSVVRRAGGGAGGGGFTVTVPHGSAALVTVQP